MESDPLFWCMLAVVALAVCVGCFMLILWIVFVCAWILLGLPDLKPSSSMRTLNNLNTMQTNLTNLQTVMNCMHMTTRMMM